MKRYKVAVVGATGAVGQQIIETLEKRKFPVGRLVPLASKRSVGKEVSFKDELYEVTETTPDSFNGIDIVFFSAGGSVSERLAKEAVKRGALVIDNTSHFRMDADVPLVVPEVNPGDIFNHQGIIANPNCSTIQMVVALNEIKRNLGLKRIVVSTYQAVSGTGLNAIAELQKQSIAYAIDQPISPEVYPHQIAFNVIPQIDVFEDNGFTKEEMKMVNETQKIFHDASIEVNATCVRVPVYRGHSEAVYIETNKDFTLEEARTYLNQTEGLTVVDDKSAVDYPTPIDAEGLHTTLVGRVRKDLSNSRGLSMWVVSDNLLKGAALNAVQIAEVWSKKNDA